MVIASLEKAINSSSELIDKIQSKVSDKDLDDFISIAQKFVEIQTKYLLIKELENYNPTSKIDHKDLQDAISENEEIKKKIFELQNLNDKINPDELKSLIDKSKKALFELQQKLINGSDPKIDQMIKDAQTELEHLEESNKSNDWYKAAYQKLSKFTGIEINDDETIKLLGSHTISIQNETIIMNPNDVFIGDLHLGTVPLSVRISEIIERISALRDLKNLAQKLGWTIDVSNSAPIASLHPPRGITKSSSPAIFALIGCGSHPLIKWGNININEFNSDQNHSLFEKIKSLQSQA